MVVNYGLDQWETWEVLTSKSVLVNDSQRNGQKMQHANNNPKI